MHGCGFGAAVIPFQNEFEIRSLASRARRICWRQMAAEITGRTAGALLESPSDAILEDKPHFIAMFSSAAD